MIREEGEGERSGEGGGEGGVVQWRQERDRRSVNC